MPTPPGPQPAHPAASNPNPMSNRPSLQVPTRTSTTAALTGGIATAVAAAAVAATDPSYDLTTKRFFLHSSAPRQDSDAVIVEALRIQYPGLHCVVAPTSRTDLVGFARAGHATYSIIEDKPKGRYPESLRVTFYQPPARRSLDDDDDGDDSGEKSKGSLVDELKWGKLAYNWGTDHFIVYVADGSEDNYAHSCCYILAEKRDRALALVAEAGAWWDELHDELWVYDSGYWQKSSDLYQSVRGSSWDNVILDEGMKKSLINDHLTFFRSRDSYKRLRVPWKRGIIYYGPPGNGKTISIKAMMNTLMSREPSIPSLYVRSLVTFGGPQYAISDIFNKARSVAPCYLIFEDIDTIVTPDVRSYFLNEVDGLKANDGIFMVGSTNHLDRLDPGISERPSRFDRKYLFPDPSFDERVAYCHFWQKKLADNEDVEFPDKLCKAIAGITDEFSFAYMQEAFVASLLAIARRSDEDADGDGSMESVDDEWVSVLSAADDDLKKLVLWVEMKKQVEILRDGMGKESREVPFAM